MIGGNAHSLGEIETMGIEPLHARIELEIFATVLARCLMSQSINSPRSAGTIAVARDEIIDIEIFAGKERFEKSITGNGANLSVGFKK